MPLCRAEPPVQKVVSKVVQSRSVPGGPGGGGAGGAGAWMVLATAGFSILRAVAEEARSVARRSMCNIVAVSKTQGLSAKGETAALDKRVVKQDPPSMYG